MRNTNSIQIDKQKLKAELRKRGSNIAAAGIKIGYSNSAVQNAADRGRMPMSMINLLNTFFGIKESDIAPDPEANPAEKLEEVTDAIQQTWLTVEQLAQIIRSSVFNALQDWNEVRNNSPRRSA